MPGLQIPFGFGFHRLAGRQGKSAQNHQKGCGKIPRDADESSFPLVDLHIEYRQFSGNRPSMRA